MVHWKTLFAFRLPVVPYWASFCYVPYHRMDRLPRHHVVILWLGSKKTQVKKFHCWWGTLLAGLTVRRYEHLIVVPHARSFSFPNLLEFMKCSWNLIETYGFKVIENFWLVEKPGKPQFDSDLGSMNDGDQKAITCFSANGQPTPTFQWFIGKLNTVF